MTRARRLVDPIDEPETYDNDRYQPRTDAEEAYLDATVRWNLSPEFTDPEDLLR